MSFRVLPVIEIGDGRWWVSKWGWGRPHADLDSALDTFLTLLESRGRRVKL